ncbi:conserved hypothetical protein [Leishmania infantum JPCM5]|uniref:RNA_recognition_motif_(A.k.a._RRM_-_RBD_-_or_RNP_domain)/RNA_recognition_motif._(A.k.a._RRM_-_RBD_-_or_RNP_domain)_-_putative n=2 Tax=Leishmania infantum TaxID=5671 RepID=A0A6L0XG13_LEIIN|nr:conserved hypothetical protein [Leishmania infantum JPCM5]CAC9496926.1 RNA_recognition_motif_(a.k.a._RRM_-_RBD_-_or_RNP_domain)/RNA_recognition_motif._(a.k.a._RRM_-_RBD_-_or_RNP_domain)_-_putative [Leishmania infantum]CAM68874.2 conserved hypothetical protein [Leishmania infantum JPCM5]SUZ42743.1 RNA_recognition_motif_(a.k.a._RRM_-_RBD_-_or_RNP_domain)/RNA_recognition_motif._(a.k.a._RRM_-_RBD_-_or_RNP_domain)_-_putative [Leishmania infantum]|eukprot:XP_001470498.2 conserved hypothetical protein [Leishmania infantum JPCM5]
MDTAATNLSAHAKPWAPNGPGLQQPQMQHPRSHSNQYSQDSGVSSVQGAGMQRGMRTRGCANNGSANSMMVPGQHHHEYGSMNGMPHSIQQHQLQQPKLSSTAAKLFVGQLPFECTEERLRNLFSAYGNVEHIHILRDNSNRSRGAAFITLSTVQEADTAIFTLHNRYRMLTNRAIQVSYAKNSPNISPFGTHSAVEVHQSNPTNPLPDVAGLATQMARLF